MRLRLAKSMRGLGWPIVERRKIETGLEWARGIGCAKLYAQLAPHPENETLTLSSADWPIISKERSVLGAMLLGRVSTYELLLDPADHIRT